MTIINALTHIYDERIQQIAIVKSLPDLYSFSPDERRIHNATTVVVIYANWEGFVRESIKIYLEYFNRQECLITNLSDVYYAYLVNQDLELKKELTSQRAILSRCTSLRSSLNKEIAYLNINVNTQSNANCDNVNALLEKLGMTQVLNKSQYGSKIDKLLKFRHDAAHGSNTIPVSNDHISEFSDLVASLMAIINVALEKAVTDQIWLRADL